MPASASSPTHCPTTGAPPSATSWPGDTKHILAWVKEQPQGLCQGALRQDPPAQGDPGCKLGVKSAPTARPKPTPRPPPPPTPSPASQQVGHPDLYWGYASGVVATRVLAPDHTPIAEVVLAERTQTFDKADISTFQPPHGRHAAAAFHPPFGAFDAAFDAFYVYDAFHNAGGFAAVPFVAKGQHTHRTFDAQGLPRCAARLAMPLKATFVERTSLVPHEKGRYVCRCSSDPDG
ncbi:MAG: hypothetical protein U0641_17015 [Anaerolineae bacterium]